MNGDFITPLSLAVQNNFVDAAMKLLEKGADPNAAICFVATPPLHQAIIHQQENLVKALLSHNANPNLMSMQGNAVHAAVKSWKAKESVLTTAITNGLIQADGSFSMSKASNLAIKLHFRLSRSSTVMREVPMW